LIDADPLTKRRDRRSRGLKKHDLLAKWLVVGIQVERRQQQESTRRAIVRCKLAVPVLSDGTSVLQFTRMVMMVAAALGMLACGDARVVVPAANVHPGRGPLNEQQRARQKTDRKEAQ